MKQEHTSGFRSVAQRNAARLDIVTEWFDEKQRLDNCPQDLWRVHDSLYDLTRYALGCHIS